jgi:putative NADPH-quinone reductase
LGQRILILDGHPDSRSERFIHALSHSYRDGARSAGHEVQTIALSVLDFQLLRSAEEFQSADAPQAARACQESILWAEHVVILFPLWHGSLPALLKGFLEQVFRPGFAFGPAQPRQLPRKLLAGRSARLIVTLGMPAPVFRWYFRAHGLKSLQRSILEFCGIKPVRTTLIGGVEALSPQARGAWLKYAHGLGRMAK